MRYFKLNKNTSYHVQSLNPIITRDLFCCRSDSYQEKAQELVMNENILLQTLGFDVAIDHPHTHVVRCCQLVKASKELAQASYYLATNSLHLTTMCLRYSSTVVACFCIHLVNINDWGCSDYCINANPVFWVVCYQG